MPGESEILVTAYKLAILTFYIGVLIYAIPLPLPGLKRWAPALMADSILAAALVFVIYALLDLSDYIASSLGGSWAFFESWYADAYTTVTGLKMIVATLYSIPDPTGVTAGLKALLSPVDKAATAALLFLLTVGGIHLLIYTYGPLLAALGVALYSVPFRILRGAGAWLIAFVLVFNAGLQVLPVFLVTVAEAPGSPVNPSAKLESGVVQKEVRLLNSMGEPLRGGVLIVYNASWHKIASYMVDGEGYARSSSGDRLVSLPAEEVIMEYVANAVRFPLEPSLVDPTTASQVLVWSPHIIWSPGSLQNVYLVGTLEGYDLGQTSAWIEVALYPGEYVMVTYPAQCPIEVVYDGLESSMQTIYWAGLEVVRHRLESYQAGVYNITLQASPCQGVEPDLDTEDYWTGLDTNFVDFNILAAFILYYFTVPMIYIVTLFIATTGLARVLGGRDKIPVRVA